MNELGMPLKGVAMNRVHPLSFDGEAVISLDELRSLMGRAHVEAGTEAEVAWLWRAYDDACTIARAEALRRESFEEGLGADVARVVVPELLEDVHDLGALARVANWLCGDEAGEGD
jgi:hypothetical protein